MLSTCMYAITTDDSAREQMLWATVGSAMGPLNINSLDRITSDLKETPMEHGKCFHYLKLMLLDQD